MRPMVLPTGWGPARPARPMLILSPFRVVLDWCDADCLAGAPGANAPKFILEDGAAVSWNRLFFRNFLPPAPPGAGGRPRRAALRAAPGLDFQSPNAFVKGGGGGAMYNLVVFHFQPGMTWVFDDAGTYWHEATQGSPPAMQNMVGRGPYVAGDAQVYNIKSFGIAPVGSIQECYIPLDVDGCFDSSNPLDEQLIYCPYTFKDSLKNPWLRRVFVFHDIGLDRLVNTYRAPVLVTRPVTYTSCRGTRHTMDIDNVTSSVLVGSKGVLSFENMALQGSKSQNLTFWPSNIPLLLSPFRVVDSGVIAQRNTTMRVANTATLIAALSALPSGGATGPDVPQLTPTFAGGRPPAPDAPEFTIKAWTLDSRRWSQWTRADEVATAVSQWLFSNVTVEQFTYPHCYHGALAQGSATAESVVLVGSGSELLEALGNVSVRLIQLTRSVTVSPSTRAGAAVVNRIVEVRACHPSAGSGGRAGLYDIDWSDTKGAVSVGGNLIFNGDIKMKGLGWGAQAAGDQGLQSLVSALVPQGPGGVIEFEDLSLEGQLPRPLLERGAGQGVVRSLLRLSPMVGLGDMAANFTLTDPQRIVFKQFYLNKSSDAAAAGPATGATGSLSFIDCTLTWGAPPPPPPGLSPAAAAGIGAAAAVVGAALLAGAGFLLWRHRRAARVGGDDGCVGPALGPDGKEVLPPRRLPSSAFEERGGAPPPAASGGASGCRGRSAAGEGGSSSHGARSGPSAEIQEACRNLVTARPSGEEDDMELVSILGEGSYGKVYKGLWRGTVVAIKVMILPSAMSGKERREKMAVMETAISSSLSHPNIVQTFTYSIKGVAANDRRQLAALAAAARGAHGSLHDSSASVPVVAPADGQAAPPPGSELGTGSDVHSWELRLVQELCDIGSLRDALNSGLFRSDACTERAAAAGVSAASLPLPGQASYEPNNLRVIDTALDVARALAHLHAQSILHSDLKARNILLKSAPAEGRGFVAKVADFGLSMEIDPQDTHISGAFQGTVTHMAPELLLSGRASKASDVYAFGILLWELYTGCHAYAGIPRALLGHSITKQGVRPEFPQCTPFDLQLLACRCWETDANIRPSFLQIMRELERMKARAAPAAPGPPPAGGDGDGDGAAPLSGEHLVLGPAAVAAATGVGTGGGAYNAASPANSGGSAGGRGGSGSRRAPPLGLPVIRDDGEGEGDAAGYAIGAATGGGGGGGGGSYAAHGGHSSVYVDSEAPSTECGGSSLGTM
ncbi:MAG: hypothetical protein J3K34DRAFT_209795 [Monoraphidium minutum]|nr:MAG: hypothetical protein J3K34DRAFT_209795 [Monoraphidium minutum]